MKFRYSKFLLKNVSVIVVLVTTNFTANEVVP